jgi:hypothetical protein
MNARRILAGLLIAAGVMMLAYQTVTHKSRETVLDDGPLQVTAESQRTNPLPPIVGGIVLLSGIALLVTGHRKSTAAATVGKP